MRFNTTLTNVSPLLVYTPAILWSEAPPNDPLLTTYYTESYHSTNSSMGNGTMLFSWNGTGIWLYGGYRDRLGPYEVVLDGKSTPYPGYQAGDSQTGQHLLFSQDGLDPTSEHTITLSNIGGTDDKVLDFDYLMVESTLDGDTVNTIVQDTSPQFEYISQGWTSNPSSHTTQSDGSVRFNFSGEAISLYGAFGGDNSSFIVTLDDEPPNPYYSNTRLKLTQQLLVFASNLQPGNHSLCIRSDSSSLKPGSTTLSISHATVYSTTSDSSAAGAQSSSKKTTVVAASAMGAASIFIFVCLFGIWRRRRERQRAQQRRIFAPRPFPEGHVALQPRSRASPRAAGTHLTLHPSSRAFTAPGFSWSSSPHYRAPHKVARPLMPYQNHTSPPVTPRMPTRMPEARTWPSREASHLRRQHVTFDSTTSPMPPPPYHMVKL